MSEKIFIKNRKDQKIAVVVEKSPDQTGLAFVMHGLGGNKEQPHVRIMAEAFLDKEFTVISFDTTNTLGESDGKYEDGNVTTYYEDLKDVINWASKQDWYEEPFWLAGHSIGGMCSVLFNEESPTKVKALAPMSTTISWELLTKKYSKKELEEWEKTGRKEWINKEGKHKKLPWSFIEDLKSYNVLEKANEITVPVLLIVGDENTSDPELNQRLLFDKLSGDKEIHIIKGAPHTFRDPKHLEEIKEIMEKWIERIQS